MKGTILRAVTVILAAVALTFATLSPASAGTAKIRDRGGHGPLNIHKAKISYKKKRVVASTKVTNLRKKHNQGVAFHFKTVQKRKKKRRYAAVIILRKRGGTILVKGGKKVVKCKKLKTKVNFKRDRAKVKVPRKCLSKPRKIRLRVETGKVEGARKDITRWTKWVKRR